MSYRFSDYANRQTRAKTCSSSVVLPLAVAIAVPFFVSPAAGASSSPEAHIIVQNRIDFQNLYVDPRSGSDLQGDGTQQRPFQTITKALEVAQPGGAINLVPGRYTVETGESFPLILPAGVTIKGNSRNQGANLIIEGGGSFNSNFAGRQNATFVVQEKGTISGITVSNPSSQGHGIWIETSNFVLENSSFVNNGSSGIYIAGNNSPTISNNYFRENSGSGIIISGNSKPQVRDNVITNSSNGIRVIETAAPILIGNRLLNNKIGVLLEDSAQPMLRDNQIENSQQDGLLAKARSRPDLGTNGQPGRNTFSNNNQFDINNQTDNQTISAFGSRLTGRVQGKINGVENANNVSLSDIIETGTNPTLQPISNIQINSRPRSNPVQIQAEAAEENVIPIPVYPAPNNTPPSETFNTPRRELRDLLILEPSPLPNVRGDDISLNDFPALPTIETSVFSPPSNNSPNITDPNITPETSQYKVIVETRNSSQEAIVRSLVPAAFRITYNGRSMMQVGLFDNIENAEEIVRTLNRRGLQGIIVPL
ncbi:MAG: DUF1565 domain-containing protein [Oscillatoria sp. PMC 1051.18]|nr:DUF1565 domain-containing protein [Oscillatoria sp. PMC 1050.18]MEC5032471.1 DUF1565 domain-containing protein [Oscillatoria sp. PMC 1051.18]